MLATFVSRPACVKCCVLNAFAQQETFNSVHVLYILSKGLLF